MLAFKITQKQFLED